MRKLLIIMIILGAVVIAAIMTMLRPEPPKKERVVLAPLVEVLVLEPMNTRFTIRTQGTVRPRTQTVLSSEVAGAIIEISPKFVAGGVFQPNEVLMRIDPTNYRVAVEQAEALVEQRQIEYSGSAKLLEQGYRAEAEYASAAAALASAKAELVRANKNLARTAIQLPYRGIVRSKDTDLGQFVNAGTRVGVVFATDVAEIRLPLTDLDLAFIDLPNAAAVVQTGKADGPNVTLSAISKGKPVQWRGTIVRTEGVVDESSRVTYAVAQVEDPYRLQTEGVPLPVGTFVSAAIEGRQADGIFRIPRVLVRGSDQVVFVDEQDRLEIRTIQIVRSDSEFVYFRSGGQPGDRVVPTGSGTPSVCRR
ncbi:MAG: efflux RND transporter periplasmic adaptor subunit [Pseudomonadota bacterium]